MNAVDLLRSSSWITLIAFLALSASALAEDLQISSFTQQGKLQWESSHTTGFYRVEWNNVLGPQNWRSDWDELSGILAQSGTTTVSVPLFYRVVYDSTNFLWGTIPLTTSYWENVSSDSYWTFGKGYILRAGNPETSELLLRRQIPKPFIVRFCLQPIALNSGDGKGVAIRDSQGQNRNVTINDAVSGEGGWEYLMWSAAGERRAGANSPLISRRTIYPFEIALTATSIVANINGVVLTDSWSSTPPYTIELIAQRSGYVLTDFSICETE
jgi:hypothetical protein